MKAQLKFEPCDAEDCQVCCDHWDKDYHGSEFWCLDCGYHEHQFEPKHSACGQER